MHLPAFGCKFREVRGSDVDALAAINVAVWCQDENYSYRFQHAQQYPQDLLKYSRLRYLEYLESVDAGIYCGMVAEVPGAKDAAGSEVVAFGFWQLPGDHKQAAEDHGQPRHTASCSVTHTLSSRYQAASVIPRASRRELEADQGLP